MDDPVAAVAADTDHGSAHLSGLALEALPERARTADYGAVAALARDLRTARPSMHAVANRVNRVMAEADPTAESVAEHALRVREAAERADDEAATAAAERLPDRVLTLSRSGTVAAALDAAAPDAVTVLESRPGGEGVAVAESLADATAVTLAPDAAVADAMADTGAVLVGADAVLPDGSVVNKVGTHTAASVAARFGVPFLAVCAGAKVAPAGTDDADREPRDPAELYDGDAPVRVHNPTFDRTPADLATVVTERGVLDTGDVRDLAAEHAALAQW